MNELKGSNSFNSDILFDKSNMYYTKQTLAYS